MTGKGFTMRYLIGVPASVLGLTFLAACGDPSAPTPAAPEGVPERWESSAPHVAPEAGDGEIARSDGRIEQGEDEPRPGDGDRREAGPDDAEPDALAYNPDIVRWDGFGPARFGSDEEAVRMAWGRPLEASEPAQGASCYQLFQEPSPPGGRGVVFLFEDDGFRRYEVDIEPVIAAHIAPGGVAVGDEADAVPAAFDAVDEAPHKYVDGARTFSVDAPDGETRLVFETDAQDRIASWRIGELPQVDYVEGCA